MTNTSAYYDAQFILLTNKIFMVQALAVAIFKTDEDKHNLMLRTKLSKFYFFLLLSTNKLECLLPVSETIFDWTTLFVNLISAS